VTASEDGTVRLWATRDGKALSDPLKLLQDEFPLCAAFSHDGKEVFAVSNAGNVWRWDAIRPKQATMPIRALRRDLTAASIGPDARTLIATGSENGRSVAWLWGADPASPPTELLNQAFVTNFAAEGTRVGTLDANQTLTIWDVASGRPISTFTGQEIAALSASAERIVVKGSVGNREVAKSRRQGVRQPEVPGRCATAGDSVMQTFKRDPSFQVGNRFACLSAQQSRPNPRTRRRYVWRMRVRGRVNSAPARRGWPLVLVIGERCLA
jgi:WD40 repeat protein